MLIENTKQVARRVGAVEEVISDVTRIELPDRPERQTVVCDLMMNGMEPNLKMGSGAIGDHIRDPGPLWRHARDFFAHEFNYLGGDGAKEMADRFCNTWRRSQERH